MLSSTLNILTRRQIEVKHLPLIGVELIEAAIEDRFRGTDELDDDAFPVGEVLVDRGVDRRELQREQDLGKEPLLGPLEPAARCRLGAAVERLVLEAIDDPVSSSAVSKLRWMIVQQSAYLS
jgi:hypothetical protein